MESMLEYKVLKKWEKAIPYKHMKVMNSPKGYHRIKVHLGFAVKFDSRHKARLVADGNLTPESKILTTNFFTLLIGKCDLHRIHRFCTRVGLIILKSHSLILLR